MWSATRPDVQLNTDCYIDSSSTTPCCENEDDENITITNLTTSNEITVTDYFTFNVTHPSPLTHTSHSPFIFLAAILSSIIPLSALFLYLYCLRKRHHVSTTNNIDMDVYNISSLDWEDDDIEIFSRESAI